MYASATECSSDTDFEGPSRSSAQHGRFGFFQAARRVRSAAIWRSRVELSFRDSFTSPAGNPEGCNTSVPAKGPHADSANSAASRLIKNHSSNHDARYNDC